MKKFKVFIGICSITVFLICLYCFLLGNKIFEMDFENDVFAWYCLAKGIFCSLALYLLVLTFEAVKDIKK